MANTPGASAVEKKESTVSSISSKFLNSLMFSAYLVLEGRSAQQRVMGEERVANSWCLQLHNSKEQAQTKVIELQVEQ